MRWTDATPFIPPSNYSRSRDGYKPKGIVLHITGDNQKGKAVEWFRNPASEVSAHYVIEKDGEIVMCVDPMHKAYHCGKVNNPTAQIYFDMGKVNPNKYMIGVECVSSGEPLTQEQDKSARVLVEYLSVRFGIPENRYHVIGHNELDSVERKFDPVASYTVDSILRKDVAVMEEKKDHWAQGAFDYCNANGIKINEMRFDGGIARGEVFTLLAQLLSRVKELEKKA